MKNGRRYYAFLFERVLSENKVRPSSVCFTDSFPRGGRLYQRQKLKIQMVLLQSVMKHPAGALQNERWGLYLPPCLKGFYQKTSCAHSFEMFLSENKLRPSSVAVRRHLPPRGKAISKAEIESSNGFVTIRYETPCGCVMKRAMGLYLPP